MSTEEQKIEEINENMEVEEEVKIKKDKKEKKSKKEKKEKKDKKEKKEKKDKKEKKGKKEKKEKKRKLEDTDEEEQEQSEQEEKKQKIEETEEAEESSEKEETVEKEKATIFVGNLSYNMTEDWLAEEFKSAGEVIGARIITDRESGRSKGYGYVDFADQSSAEKAVNELNGKEIDGREVRLDFANTPNKQQQKPKRNFDNKPQSTPSKTVFIGNLSWNTTEDSLTELFNSYGEIVSIRIPTERETGRKKGFGYVEFTDEESAGKALELSGTEVDGRNIRLDYAPERNNNNGGGSFGGRDRRGGGGRGGNRGGRGRGGFGGRGGRGGNRGGRSQPSYQGQKITFDD